MPILLKWRCRRRMKNTLFTLSRCAFDIVSCVSSAHCLQLFLPLFHLPDLTVVMISVPDSKFIITNIFPQPWVITAHKLLVEDQLYYVDHIRQILFAILAFNNVLEHINIWRKQTDIWIKVSICHLRHVLEGSIDPEICACILNNEAFHFSAVRFLGRSNRDLDLTNHMKKLKLFWACD